MLIGFMGSHGTGKTSTAHELSSITRIHFLGSTARVADQIGLAVNQEADYLSQLLVTVSRANQVLRAKERIITDRTPLDSLAYTTYQIDYMWKERPDYLGWYLRESRSLVEAAMERYTHLFYFPICWESEEDGLRKADPDYQRAIDDRILVLIREMNLPVVTMPNVSASERAYMIKQAVVTSTMV